VATSERVLTSLSASAGAQQHSIPHGFIPSPRPAWMQMLLDFVAIAIGLNLVPATVGELQAHSMGQVFPLSPTVAAMMITTILAFTGTYTHPWSPIDIAGTEALVRGLCCVIVLMAIGSIGFHTTPPASVIATAIVVMVVLVVERECIHILSLRKPLRSWSSSPGYSFSPVALATALLPDPKTSRHLETGFEQSYATYLVKRALDIAGAGILLVAVSPLLVSVAVLIKIDSKGPALIRQRRIGRRGVPFYMWKFRSMQAEVARYARSPVSDADPRLTRFGRALRRFSIDELPQLFNILQGNMSLVGPRPEMPFIVKKYEAHERLRLNAMPGITGLWQISPARAMPIHENLELDLFYIQHQNVFLDLAILLRTVTAVVRGIGAR
jgi:lipopolysaccharide/colanic/teichoic acid biosynthesis glycosyltransferase